MKLEEMQAQWLRKCFSEDQERQSGESQLGWILWGARMKDKPARVGGFIPTGNMVRTC